MLVSEQNPSSDLTILVKRAKIVNDKELSIIPDPVFEPVSYTHLTLPTS